MQIYPITYLRFKSPAIPIAYILIPIWEQTSRITTCIWPTLIRLTCWTKFVVMLRLSWKTHQ